jgi:predicted RNA-binding Zn ribbon-like protein
MTDIRNGQEPGERAPAPEPLRLVQRFLNTVDLEDDLEVFTSPAALGEWLVTARLISPGTTLTVDDLHRAIAFREALRDLLAAHTGHPVPGDAADRFRTALGAATLGGAVDASGGISLVPRASGLDGALATLLATIHTASVDGTWQRLKTCHNHACRWAFYDASRNRSGTWCAMGICGSRNKARTWRRRHGS